MLNSEKPYVKILIESFGTISLSNDEDKLKDMRKKAFAEILHRIFIYEKDNYDERLLTGIAEKKCKMILEATTKDALNRIMKPKAPHYNGVEFIADEYSVPEEELIGWNKASLKAPLNSAASKRYFSVFKQIFPDANITI